MTDGLWTKLTIATSQEAVEAVTGILLDIGVGGVEVLDPEIWEQESSTADLYGEVYPRRLPLPGPAHVGIIVHLAGDRRGDGTVELIQNRVRALKEVGLDPWPATVDLELVSDSDWANGWKKYYHPQRIGQRIVIRPTWEPYAARAHELVIALDPGMAFGTGDHATTRLCLLRLEQLVKPGMIVYDIGTGSGILSLAAAKLGAMRVEACDLDPVAVEVAKANIGDNGLSDVITVHPGPIDTIRGQAHVVVANIITDVIIELMPKAVARLLPGGHLIASGIISERKDEVLPAFAKVGLEIVAEESSNDWLVLVGKL